MLVAISVIDHAGTVKALFVIVVDVAPVVEDAVVEAVEVGLVEGVDALDQGQLVHGRVQFRIEGNGAVEAEPVAFRHGGGIAAAEIVVIADDVENGRMFAVASALAIAVLLQDVEGCAQFVAAAALRAIAQVENDIHVLFVDKAAQGVGQHVGRQVIEGRWPAGAGGGVAAAARLRQDAEILRGGDAAVGQETDLEAVHGQAHEGDIVVGGPDIGLAALDRAAGAQGERQKEYGGGCYCRYRTAHGRFLPPTAVDLYLFASRAIDDATRSPGRKQRSGCGSGTATVPFERRSGTAASGALPAAGLYFRLA